MILLKTLRLILAALFVTFIFIDEMQILGLYSGICIVLVNQVIIHENK